MCYWHPAMNKSTHPLSLQIVMSKGEERYCTSNYYITCKCYVRKSSECNLNTAKEPATHLGTWKDPALYGVGWSEGQLINSHLIETSEINDKIAMPVGI